MAEALSPEEQIMALRRELAERDAIIAAREAELAEATIVKAKLTAALLEIEQIKMQLATLRRQRYGRSSEKLDSDIAQLEMRLEDCEEDVGEHLAARPDRDRHRHSAPRPRGKSGRKPLPPHLPREVVVHEPEIVCSCGNCDPAHLARLGEIISKREPISMLDVCSSQLRRSSGGHGVGRWTLMRTRSTRQCSLCFT